GRKTVEKVFDSIPRSLQGGREQLCDHYETRIGPDELAGTVEHLWLEALDIDLESVDLPVHDSIQRVLSDDRAPRGPVPVEGVLDGARHQVVPRFEELSASLRAADSDRAQHDTLRDTRPLDIGPACARW